MKIEISSLFLDEKICFIRLPLYTLQKNWQIMYKVYDFLKMM
jgi:hypothetical protein